VNAEPEKAMADIRAMVTYFSELFGAHPFSQMTVVEAPVTLSHGFPSLVYLNFADSELMRARAVAAQWLGNAVGWRSYHDQWLTEALANYAAAMYVENRSPARFGDLLGNARQQLLAPASVGGVLDSVGPLWIGHRLASASMPDAHTQILYNKGMWVIHMLRMLMREDDQKADEMFLKMVREFVQTFRGQRPSTWDFKQIAEKYMTQGMDLYGDKKLDWFFDQWVFGTGIPAYALEYRVEPVAEGFLIQGQVVQTNVPESFAMPVPIYADDQFLGRVRAGGDNGIFRFNVPRRPERVLLDPFDTVLKISK
jgi:hypothetical protein